MAKIQLVLPAFQEQGRSADGAGASSEILSRNPSTRSFKVTHSGHFLCEKATEELRAGQRVSDPLLGEDEDAGKGAEAAYSALNEALDETATIVDNYNKHGKRVEAGKDVLERYHDSYLYGTYPLTTRVRTALRTGNVALFLGIVEFLASATSVGFYVASTKDPDGRTDSRRLSLGVISVYFVADYFLKVYSSAIRVGYVFSSNGILDLVTSLPIIFFFSDNLEAGAPFRILLFLRLLRPAQGVKSFGLLKSSIAKECLVLLVYLLSIVFVAAGMFQWVEKIALSNDQLEALGCPLTGCFNFYDAFYFIVVTISTVGYGDVTPNTSWGRLVVIFIIVATLVIIPVQINKILDVVSRSPYGGYNMTNRISSYRYIILCGNVSHRTVTDFLYAFYHPVHDEDLAAYPLRVTVMAPYKPSFELKSLVALYNGLVSFVEGSPLNWGDLDRVGAREATAIYVLGDSFFEDADAEDSAQIVQALSVQRYCGNSTRILVEIVNPEDALKAVWNDVESTVDIVCPEAVRFKLLACSCYIKGVTTFISNLFRPGLYIAKPLHNHFMFEYYRGHLQEVYPVLLPEVFHNLRFEAAAEFCYMQFGVMLFGLDVIVEESVRERDARRQVFLFPKSHLIGPTDVGLVIAENIRTAEMISKFDAKQKPFFKSWKSWRYFSTLPTLTEAPQHVQNATTGLSPFERHKQSMALFAEITEMWNSIISARSNGQILNKGLSASIYRTPSAEEENSSHLAADVERAARGSADEHQPETKGRNPTSKEHVTGDAADEMVEKLSLNDALEKLLTWPPLVLQQKPHPAILSKRRDEILDHLENHTLSVVHLDKPHILACFNDSWPHNLFHFVSHLRTGPFPEMPVVFLCEVQPTSEEWGCLGLFPEVYFVSGSPLYELDLMRAGVVQAAKVLILSRDGHLESGSHEEEGSTGDNMCDSDNLVIAANVERLKGSGDELLVELQHELAFQYLRPKWLLQRHRLSRTTYVRNRDAVYQFVPPYQSGKAFCPVGLCFLTFATFYNRNVNKIVEQMLSGGPAVGVEDGEVRRLGQVAVPSECCGRTYADLVKHLLHEKGLLALGLYRAKGTKEALVPFVHTNPPGDVSVSRQDLVFVLM